MFGGFERLYRAVYCAPELQRGLHMYRLHPDRITKDFAATGLEEARFVEACEAVLANAPPSQIGELTQADWDAALEPLLCDESARRTAFMNLTQLKRHAQITTLNERSVFDPNVPTPLARHPLLPLDHEGPPNLFTVRF